MRYPTFKYRDQYFIFFGPVAQSWRTKSDILKFYKDWDLPISLQDDNFAIIKDSQTKGGDIIEDYDVSDDFDLDDIDDLLAADTTTPTTTTPTTSARKKNAQRTETSASNFKDINIVTFPMIYDFDNVLEIKQKFAYVVGEPMFKLHFMYSLFGTTHMMSYKIHVGIQPLTINLPDFLENKELEHVQNIPINLKLSGFSEFTQIKAYDIATTYGQLSEVACFEVTSLDKYVNPSQINSLSSNELFLIYEGFVKFFWPMISNMNIFNEYVHDPVLFLQQYPNVANPHLRPIFAEEHRIIQNINNISEKDMKTMNKNQFMSIISLVVQFNSFLFSDSPIINLRSLFDAVKLDDHMTAIKCNVMLDTNFVVLQKAYKQQKFIEVSIPRNSCVIRYFIDPMKYEFLDLYVFSNGNINVRARLSREENYSFQSILDMTMKYINPIIRHINTFGDQILYNNQRLFEITREFVKFTNIALEVIYHQPEGQSLQHNVLVRTLQQLSKAKMIILKSLEDRITFFMQKGTFVYNMDKIEKNMVIQNYYSFLTNSEIFNKWVIFFYKQRKTQVTIQHNNVSFTMSGIQEDEYGYVMTFLNYIWHRLLYPQQYPDLKDVKGEHVVTSSSSAIRQLKQFDPTLFDYNKIYKMSELYSPACQKKHQPIAKTEAEYARMSEAERKKFIKYWNFTTKSPAYYGCPHKNFPHLHFIVNKHSQGYCLPCCRKTNVSNDEIIQECLQNHKYSKTKVNKIKDTRYVMNFGKAIPPGRLCKLPPDLENLFNYYIRDSHECLIMGVEQRTYNIPSAILNIASIATETPTRILLTSLLKAFQNRNKVFYSLLNGAIIQHFSNPAAFASTLKDLIASEPNSITQFSDEVPWNYVFIDLLFYCLEINVVLFSQDMRTMDTPTKFHTFNRHSSEYKQSIIVMKQIFDRSEVFSMICEIDINTFFTTRVITTKLVPPDYQLFMPIANMINHFEMVENESVNITSPKSLSLTNLHKKMNTRWVIKELYLNKTDLVYYVGVQKSSKKGGIVRVPVYGSEILSNIDKKNINIIYTPVRKDDMPTISALSDFLDDVGLELTIDYLISYPKHSIIGIVLRGIVFYHQKCTLDALRSTLKIKDSPKVIEQTFDPDVINQVLFKATPAKPDRRSTSFAADFYSVYMYQIFILEFVVLLYKNNNKKVREKIATLLKNKGTSSEQAYMSIIEVLKEYYENRFSDWETYFDEDRLKIVQQFMDSRSQDLTTIIETSVYNFDQVVLHDLFALTDPADQYKFLDKLARQFVAILSPADYQKHFQSKSSTVVTDAPNVLLTCNIENPHFYCTRNHKLVIRVDQLKEILHLFVKDINNVLKRRWIFNILFVRDHINNYKFIQRKHETIAVNLE